MIHRVVMEFDGDVLQSPRGPQLVRVAGLDLRRWLHRLTALGVRIVPPEQLRAEQEAAKAPATLVEPAPSLLAAMGPGRRS